MTAGTSPHTGYHAATRGREPRSLLLRACDVLGPGDGRTAADLGCGSGADTLALLGRGWAVTAVDRSEAALAMLRGSAPAVAAGRLTVACTQFDDMVLPPAYLLYASYSLPFCDPDEFATAWKNIRASLQPGGVFAGHFFGKRDGWAGTDGMTFHAAKQITELAEGLEILYLREKEWDGQAATGPHHWHVFGVMFRQPSCEKA